MSVPLGDGGEKKFNWASELSTLKTNSSSRLFAVSCFSFDNRELREPRHMTQAVQTGNSFEAPRTANCSNLLPVRDLPSSNPVATFAFRHSGSSPNRGGEEVRRVPVFR